MVGLVWNVESFTRTKRPNYRGLTEERLQLIMRVIEKGWGTEPEPFNLVTFLESGEDADEEQFGAVSPQRPRSDLVAAVQGRAVASSSSALPAAAASSALPVAEAEDEPETFNAMDALASGAFSLLGSTAATGRASDKTYGAETYAYLLKHSDTQAPSLLASRLGPNVRGCALFDATYLLLAFVHMPSPGHRIEQRTAALYDFLDQLLQLAGGRPVVFGGDLNFTWVEQTEFLDPVFSHFHFVRKSLLEDTTLRKVLDDDYRPDRGSQPYDQLWVHQGDGLLCKLTKVDAQILTADDVISKQNEDFVGRHRTAWLLQMIGTFRAQRATPFKAPQTRNRTALPSLATVEVEAGHLHQIFVEVNAFVARHDGYAVLNCIIGDLTGHVADLALFLQYLADVFPPTHDSSSASSAAALGSSSSSPPKGRPRNEDRFGDPSFGDNVTKAMNHFDQLNGQLIRILRVIDLGGVDPTALYRKHISDHLPLTFRLEYTH